MTSPVAEGSATSLNLSVDILPLLSCFPQSYDDEE